MKPMRLKIRLCYYCIFIKHSFVYDFVCSLCSVYLTAECAFYNLFLIEYFNKIIFHYLAFVLGTHIAYYRYFYVDCTCIGI